MSVAQRAALEMTEAARDGGGPKLGFSSGLFLGRFAHQVAGLAAVLDDALHCVARTPAS